MNPKYRFLAAVTIFAYIVWGAFAFWYEHSQIADFLSSVKLIATGGVAIFVRDMLPAKNDSGDAAP